MVQKRIWICRFQWWCKLFLFMTINILLGQIWSKNSKLFVQSEFWYKDLLENSKFNGGVYFICFTLEILFWGFPNSANLVQKIKMISLSWKLVQKTHTDGSSWIHITETSLWCTIEVSLGVSFEICLRSRGDVLMERYCYVLLRRRHDVSIRCPGDVPLRHFADGLLRCRWVFHLRCSYNVAGTQRKTL